MRKRGLRDTNVLGAFLGSSDLTREVKILSDGEHFDAEFEGKQNDIQFYLDLVNARPGSRVLELGVGTGRVAIPLAKSGHQVYGMDVSPSMLKQAQAKATEQGVKLELKAGKIEELVMERSFDFIISPFNTLMHLPKPAMQALLGKVQSGLTSGGTFVVDVGNPSKYQGQMEQGQFYSTRYKNPKGEGDIVVTTKMKLYPNKLEFVRYFRDSNESLLSEELIQMYYFGVAEWREMVESSGLTVHAVYGDHQGGDLQPTSKSLILVCRK